jgi:hypothetical protein
MRRPAARSRGGGTGRPGKVGQVLAFGLVQLQGAGQRIEHDVGDPGEIAALQLGVVLDADTGEVGHLAAFQPRHAPVEAERRQAGALRVSRARRVVRKSLTSARLSTSSR